MATDPRPRARRPARLREWFRRRPDPHSPAATGIRRELVLFLSIALLTLLVVAGGTFVISGKLARDAAFNEAEDAAGRIADYLVEPLLDDALIDPAEKAELRRVIENRVKDRSVSAVVIWDADGDIRFASDRRQEGRRLPLTEPVRDALSGDVRSLIDEQGDSSEPYQHRDPQLEVYVPVLSKGQPLAFQAYYPTSLIEENADLVRARIVPLAVGALVILYLLQIPVVVSLGRRLGRHEAERTALVRRHLAASESERRAIAADVHDGPVQDLAGVSYALSALRPGMPEAQRPTVDRMVTAVRNAVASLRRLMVDIYPPDLSGTGLTTALQDLAAPIRERGIEVDVSAEGAPPIPDELAPVLYRTAKEALTNVAKHAEAKHVRIELARAAWEDGSPAVRLTIADDGVGFPSDEDEDEPLEDRALSNGHLGLRAMHDRVIEAGGVLSLGNGPEKGAVLTAIVPLRAEQ